MATIHQKFTGDAAQLEKEIEKLRKQHIKYEEAIQHLTDAARKSADSQVAFGKSIVDSNTKSAASIRNQIAQYVTLSGVIQAAVREQEHQFEVQKRILDTNLSVRGSQSAMIRNLGPTATKADVREMVEAARQISEETGVSQVDIFQAQGDTLSGSAGNRKLTNAIVAEAAKILADSPQEMAEFSQRVPGVMTAMGTDDPQKAMAWMTSLMGVARLVKPESFKHYSKALASGAVVQQGVSDVEATSATGAILAGIGTRLDDAEGAVTASAELRLANVLEKIVPDKISTYERIKRVQQDTGLQKKAIEAFGKENEAYPVVREILTDRNSVASNLIKSAFDSLRSSKADFENLKSNLREGSEQLRLAETVSRRDAKLNAIDFTSAAGWDAYARETFNRVIDDTPSFLGVSRMLAKHAYDNPVELDLSGNRRRHYDSGFSQNIEVGIESLKARKEHYSELSGSEDIVKKLDIAIQELQKANDQRQKVIANTRADSGAQRNTHNEGDR